MSIVVRPCTSKDEPHWDRFVYTHPEGTFFHLIGWRTVIETTFRHQTHFLLAEESDRIVGILPLAHVKSRLFGDALSSLPFCVYGGPLVCSPEVQSALDEAAYDLCQAINAPHVEYRCISSQHPEWPRQDLYVTFRKALTPDLDSLMKEIPRKQRAMVRKGIAANLTFGAGTIQQFFDIYADNVHRHGTPTLPLRYFEQLAAVFGEKVEIRMVHSKEGRQVSGVLSFLFRDQILPYYAGDLPEARDLAANDFKYWSLMAEAAQKGIRVFDYGRSKVGTGSYAFKKNWGFSPEPLHYEYRLQPGQKIPQNNPNNPKYQFFIAIWRKLPRSVVNRLGPYLVRSLG